MPSWYTPGTEEWYQKSQSLRSQSQSFIASKYRRPYCGNWQESYIRFHDRVRNGEVKANRLVVQCKSFPAVCGGLADRMVGTITAFLFSLVTDRAFFIDWYHPVNIEEIMYGPYINWTMNRNDASYMNAKTLNFINLLPPDPLWPYLLNTSYVEDEMKDHETVVWWSNRGFSWRMFSGYYKQVLTNLGLHQETAFGCIADFLIRPIPRLWAKSMPIASYLARKEIFAVGIQIRLGDKVMENANATVSLEPYMHYFECAAQLARRHALPDQTVKYFLMADTIALRKAAVRRFGDVIVTANGTTGHFDIADYASKIERLQAAVVENYIFSACDYFIITKDSGFGRMAALRSNHQHTVIQLDHNQRVETRCDVDTAFTPWSEIQGTWSGARR